MKTKEAIQFFGGLKPLADALGIWPQASLSLGRECPAPARVSDQGD